MSIRIINNVPADQAERQIQLAYDTGAISVERAQEDDGELTLLIVYPDREGFTAMKERTATSVARRNTDK